MVKTILFSALLGLAGLNAAAAQLPGALETLAALGPAPAAAPAAPAPAAPDRAAGRKFYTAEALYPYKPDAVAKAADYAASIRAAGIEVLATSILTREDGDRDLYLFSIEYAGSRTLKSEQQAGIPDKLRADIIHDDFKGGFKRAGLDVIRSGVRKEGAEFAAYCLYAQEDDDARAVRTYASLPHQANSGLDAGTLFPSNMSAAVAELEGAGMPIVFRLRAQTGWMIKFFSANKPKRLQSGVQASFTAALEDMRRTVARLKDEGKIVLDANTALVGSYWTVDYVEK